MPSVARNAPCPCGSGRKYKKCCLQRDDARARPSPPPASTVEPTPPQDISWARQGASLMPGSQPPRPYALARMVEDDPVWEAGRERDPEAWAMRTRGAVWALPLEELHARLTALGIDSSRDAFLAAAEGEVSAREVSVAWLRGRPKSSLPRFAEDFCGLAACRLWTHYLPDRPSLEMVDDWMMEGYELDGHMEYTRACETWSKVWTYLLAHRTPAMRCLKDVDRAFQGSQHVYNWVQDLELAYFNVRREGRVWAERGAAYVRQVLELFPDEDELLIGNFRADLAEMLHAAGQRTEAEATLQALIDERPESAIGYVTLARLLKETEPRRALALLETAQAKAEDPGDYDVASQIRELREAGD